MTVTELRKKHGLTQKQFAEKIGVKPCTVADWDQGRRSPDRRSKRDIKRVFGVDV